MRARFSGVFVVVMLLAAPTGRPESNRGADLLHNFGTSVDVTVVNLDVCVRDRDGRPVTGLTAADFRVRHDGERVPVSNFATVTSLSSRTADHVEVPTMASAEPAWLLIYVDNENLRPMARKRLMTRIEPFVQAVMADGARVAVASARRSMEIRSRFSDDPKQILQALGAAAKESSGRLMRDRKRRMILLWMEEHDNFMILTGLTTKEAMARRVNQIQIRGQIVANAEEERIILDDTLAGLRCGVRYLSGLPGRKALLYASNGLPLVPSIDLLHEYSEIFGDDSVLAAMPGGDRMAAFRDLAREANRQRVAFYTIDASGLAGVDGFGAADTVVPVARASWTNESNLQQTLAYMAYETGGLLIRNTNDATAGLRRIHEDLRNYYSLGYTIPASGRDAEYDVSVELPDRPEYTVRFRRTIAELSPETSFGEQVRHALLRETDNNPMDVRLRCGRPLQAANDRWKVRMQVSVPVRHLTMSARGEDLVGTIELCLGVCSDPGRESTPRRMRHQVRVPASAEALDTTHRYALYVDLMCRDQRQMVAVGVRDAPSGRVSVASMALAMP